ncbi:MAG TPA: proline--tRNA ligase [Alkalispirochaeta sp.]|nr:proline--tRNA ligase [Alkalispirochaeta sp.]
MRYSRLFTKTLTQVPKSVKSPSYRLLMQAGFVRPVSQGLFSMTPLGMRIMRNLKRIIHQEMEALGGQEVLTPLVNPRELWLQSGRDSLIEKDMVRFTDRGGRDLVLAPTHEEAMVEMLRSGLRSYRDLPVFLYQFQTKFRDEERPRCGTVRAREFIMKDAYSFHRSFTDLNNFFPKVFASYTRIFQRCNVPVIPAQAGVGYMGGERSYEFLMPSRCGDDFLVRCTHCDYAANEDVAIGVKDHHQESPLPLSREAVADAHSLTSAAGGLSVPRNRVLKAMVFRSGAALVMAVVRGDHEVSKEKLAVVIGRPIHGQATAAQLAEHGLLGPWVSPLHIPDAARIRGMEVAIDDGAADSSNLFAAVNERGVVARNANFGRDFGADRVADIVSVPEGAPCIHCNTGTLERMRVMELGNIFRLGDFYTRAMKLRLRDEGAGSIYPHMGSYGIGMGRLMAAIVDANRDDRGIIWPMEIAPFTVFLMSIGKALSVRDMVDRLYADLGADVLLDDRHESISHKLKDADLLGIPVRVVVSRESVDTGMVEVALRDQPEPFRIHERELSATITSIMEEHSSHV